MTNVNVRIEQISEFLKTGRIGTILKTLNRYSETEVDFSGESMNAIMEHPSYLEITKDEIVHWSNKQFNLSCDSDLLIDFIYRIPFIDKEDNKKIEKVKTIVDNLLQKVNNVKLN
mgnify:CR=1 FL=1